MPYAGFKGDYQSIQVLPPNSLMTRVTACGMPRVAAERRELLRRHRDAVAPAGSVFDFTPLNALNVPQFRIHLDHQARSLTGDVYRASDNKWMGEAFDFDYLA